MGPCERDSRVAGEPVVAGVDREPMHSTSSAVLVHSRVQAVLLRSHRSRSPRHVHRPLVALSPPTHHIISHELRCRIKRERERENYY